MTVTTSDVPRTAGQIRAMGELFDCFGAMALELFADWEAGAKAANLDPNTRGNAWDSDEECHIPSDPTGEAAITARAKVYDEAQRRLHRILDDCGWWRDMLHVVAPIVPPSEMNQKDDRWCDHHLRVGMCEPRHRGDECRFCYDFRLLWKVRPPVSLLRDRHQGKRLSESSIKAALEADGLIIEEVGEVTRAVRQARGSTGRPNQNRKKKAG